MQWLKICLIILAWLLLSVLLYNILSVEIVYSVQMNCTDSNYTEAAATCSAAQQHSTFTVQILYKLYSLQLNCTYSNYTQAAATCSAAQQHSTFTVQILYKLYSLQLNCTYSNYTEAAATCSAAQHERESSFCLLKCSAAGCLMLNVYIDNYIQKLDPSKKFKWLNTHCHNLTAIRNTRLISLQATARRLSLPKVRLGWDDVIQECGVIWHDVSC